MAHFTEDTLRRILINPFYTITAAPELTEQHAELAEEADWVQENTSYVNNPPPKTGRACGEGYRNVSV